MAVNHENDLPLHSKINYQKMGNNNFKTLFSSKEMEWKTPKDLFEELDKEFNFTLDFCASKKNTKCKRFYSEKEDALKQNPKGEVIFCNPPYGKKIKDFVKKCYDLSRENTVVLLIPARTDTSYFQDYMYRKAELRFIRGRLKFIGNQKASGSAPFPSMICIFNKTQGEAGNSYKP